MTDDELIELIQTKTPEELSVEEIDQLRMRLPVSSALQEALVGRLEMEQYLTNVLGGIQLDVDRILARAEQVPAGRQRSLLWLWGCVACCLLLGVTITWIAIRNGADGGSKEIAELDPRAPGAQNHLAGDKQAPKGSAAEQLEKLQPRTAKSTDPTELAKLDSTAGNKPTELSKREPWEPEIPWAEQPEPGPEALFEEPDQKTPAPLEADLRRWFTEVQGKPRSISNWNVQGENWGWIDGLFKLNAPWVKGVSLRLASNDFNNLKIYCWNGSEGAALVFSEAGYRQWAGYATRRKDNKPRPAELCMTARDDARFWRTNLNSPICLELRYEDGAITLSRGDIRLVSVPMAQAPAEIYFDGRAAFRQLAMVKSAPLPPERPQFPIALDVPRPAELTWNENLPEGFKCTKHADGSLELKSDAKQGVATVWTQLPALGICEVILQLDAISARTGLYFGNAEGKPTSTTGFGKDNRAGQLAINKAAVVGQWIPDQDFDLSSLAPYVTNKLWVKMSYSGGATRVSTSVDGEHWGRPFSPFWGDHGRGYLTFGLYCLGQPSTSIKLSRMTYRVPQALMALAPQELRDKVPLLPVTGDYGAWLQSVSETRPVGTELSAWRKACALSTFARGTWSTLGNAILEGLIDQSLAETDDPQQQLQLLDEGIAFLMAVDDTILAQRWTRKYEQIGWQAYQRGESRPFSLIIHRQMTVPLAIKTPYTWFSDALARAEMLELVYQQRWDDLADVTDRLQMWKRQSYPRGPMLQDWAAVLASRGLAVTTEPDPDAFRKKPKKMSARKLRKLKLPVVTMQSDWRHPLITELSKEGFNVLAEFDAALGGKLYKDACQIISGTPGSDMLGLLPNSKDAQLLTSLSGAVTLAMRDDSALAATMVEEFGPIGLLRIRQAIRDGDAQALEAATLQFYGTPAAAEAHLWLGDRALAAGAVAHALGQYRQARRSAASELQARIAASEQLALAMTGQPSGEAISEAIAFGQTKLTPAELKLMLDDLRQHHAADALGNLKSDLVAAAQHAPAPIGLKATVRGPFDGDQGQSPQSVPGALLEFDVDWFARQMATVLCGDRLVVSNRFQVAAYDLKEHRWLWRTGLRGEQGSAHEWSLTPMHPLVTSNRIFVRRLTRQGPTLAAIDASSGRVVWSTKTESDRSVVSDPLLVQDELFALVMSRVDQEYLLSLCTYDPETGTQLTERRVAHFRDLWQENRTCEAIAAGDHFIVVCGGSVLSFDLTGQPQWVRRQTLVPNSLDRAAVKQRHDLPLIAEGRLYVTQPGVREVTCLDPETGGLIWRRTMADIQAMLGVDSGRLLVRSDDGLTALDAVTGKPVWQYADRNLLDGTLLGGPGGLLISRCPTGQGEEKVTPELVWLDPVTGRPKSVVALDALKQKKPRIGPLVAQGDKLWAFVRSAAGEQRDIVELEPQADLAVANAPNRVTGFWTSQIPAPLQAATERVLPGWTLLDGKADAKTGYEAEFNGERDILNTLGKPAILARQVMLPPGSPKLVLRVGHNPQGRWKFEVRVNGDQLSSETVEAKTTQNCWKTCEVDLSAYAGREVNLVVRSIDDGNQPYHKWKRLEIE